MARREDMVSTPLTVRRAVRSWMSRASTISGDALDIPGATSGEKALLARLGGLASAIGGPPPDTAPGEIHNWMDAASVPPDDVVELVRRGFDAGFDPLAEAYNACISAPNRRLLGTVFTPREVVDHMIELVESQLDETPACVIDPGAGVGAFTVAAGRKWPEAKIIAVDVNVVTLGLLSARISYEQKGDRLLADRRKPIELRLADYAGELPVIFGTDDPSPIVALGNPPYTRTQAMDAEYKRQTASLQRAVGTSGHANLATLFQALTFEHLRPHDLSCMVLPGSIAYTQAARALRRALWQSRRSIVVHRWRADTKPFVGHNVQAAVLLVGQEVAPPPRVLRLARAETGSDSVTLIREWDLDRDQSPPENWFWGAAPARRTEQHVLLDAIAKIRRGTATGANSFFFLTDDARAAFPDSAVVPAVASLRRFDGTEMTEKIHSCWGGPNERRWLLALDPMGVYGGALKRYLDEHEGEVRERHLASQRKKWWAITELPCPDIFLSPLAQAAFKVVVNSVHAVGSNNLLGLTVRAGDPRPLADWLRSSDGQAELRRVSRRYSGGSLKVEPGGLKTVLVPQSVCREIDETLAKRLASAERLFDFE